MTNYRLLAHAMWMAAFLVPQAATAADVSVKAERCKVSFTISGEIKLGDADKIRSALSTARSTGVSCDRITVHAFFDSTGGEVSEAIAIGRALRASRAWAFLPSDSTCVSSCVLAFVGGAHRSFGRRLGIHRPYFVDARGLTPADIQRTWREMDGMVRSYLEEMNVSSSVAELMVSTPPEEVRWLSFSRAEGPPHRRSGRDR